MTNATPPLKVLIVDDAASMRQVLRTLLNHHGYHVVGELNDGTQVLHTVQTLRPDIVCLDLHMPGKDGLSVMKELHAIMPEQTVVMITGDENPETRHAASEAGTAGFLRKPFSQAQILDELQHVSMALKLLQARGGSVPKPDETVPDYAPGRHTVVIADDSTTLRRLLRVILEDIGLEVVGEACDGEQAIALVKEKKPELLCLDVEMPVLDGLGALASIHQEFPAMPVMMITSRADRETVQKAAQGGATGYIIKPYKPEVVGKVIHRLFPDT